QRRTTESASVVVGRKYLQGTDPRTAHGLELQTSRQEDQQTTSQNSDRTHANVVNIPKT
ncbi:unnamed protein product, partial [Candidula unifasciata]